MKALICGVTGQDGSYLAKLLLEKGYEVVGTSRDAMMASLSNLLQLNIKNDIALDSMAVNDFRSVLGVVQRHTKIPLLFISFTSKIQNAIQK